MDDTPTLLPAPYFDPDALERELAGLRDAHAGPIEKLRPLIVKRLKSLLTNARGAARAALEADGDGVRCTRGLSEFQDALIRLLYAFTTSHVYPAANLSTSERLCVAATGGYGRGMLAPSSDVDVLFVLPYKQTAWGESVTEFMLYVLWDMGLKVGHAVRTIDQCVALAKADMTIRTALLDARFILGSAELFAEFERRFREEVVRGTDTRAFFEAKLAERDKRDERTGQSRYRVEPNVKDGKGGLRDLHTLHWLSRYLSLAETGDEARAAELSVFSPAELRLYRKCERMLWTVRCHIHFMTGRPEERLSFDLQPMLAEVLGYKQHGGLKRVERFMRHYFLTAKEVGELTLIACTALEMKQLKATPLRSRLLAPLTWRSRAQLRRRTDFRIENGRMTVADREAFNRNPLNLIRLFQLAEEHGVPFHPDAWRLVRQSLHLIDDGLRADPEANRIFLGLLTARSGVERVLRSMSETGVLGRFLPAFGRVVAMMQFNMYHHYTVDEHLIRSVGLLSGIEAGTLEEDHPLASQIIRDVESRRVLYVAQLLHDIGKGRKEDHSKVGARIARELCPRLGLAKAETDTVAWLVEHHLDMTVYAQSRDISDPKTIQDFAAIVQSPERLRLLLILTVADIRAVGPGVWNGWKGQLLRTLYHETEPVLAGGHSRLGRKERVAEAQAALRQALTDWPSETADRFVARLEADYWLRTPLDRQIAHANLCRRAETEGVPFAFEVTTDAFKAVTELTVLARNVPRLLALFAGACAAAEADIMGAHISTTRDGFALDTFLLKREHDEADERRMARRIGETIGKLLAGTLPIDRLMAKRRKVRGRLGAFKVEPQCTVSDRLSDGFTVIEVAGLDRPGLLYDLTSAISGLDLDINSAHITTYGERAVDVFYVTGLDGRKIVEEARRGAVRQRLLQVLAGA